MDQGGLPEAVARMLLAVMRADRDSPRSPYESAGRLFQTEIIDSMIDCSEPEKIYPMLLCFWISAAASS